MRTRQLLGASAVATLLVVGVAGCVKLDMDLQLQSDDTVDGSMVFAISQELAELSGQDPEDLAQGMKDDLLGSAESGAEVRTEPYDDGEYVGATMFFEGESLDTFAGGGAEESLTIVRDGDEFVVSGTMDLSQTDGAELGLSGNPDLRIAVTFPGAVSDHDGELDGTTVSWVPVAGELTEINARGSAIEGGGGISPLLLGGLAVLVLAVVAAVILLAQRSRRTTSSPAAPAAEAPAAEEPVTPPTTEEPTAPVTPATAEAPAAPQTAEAPADEQKPPTV